MESGYDYEQFIVTVQREAGISWDEAHEVVPAVLSTLAERISQGKARDIASRLPGNLGKWLATETNAQPFGADEFLRRIADREDVDLDTAERHAQAVFRALGRSLSPDERADLGAELPKDFGPLIRAAADEADDLPAEVVPAEEFVSAVANRAGLGEGAARVAIEAVLETLGERLASGEVEDLAKRLPPELSHSLEWGNQRTNGKAERLSLDEFVERVADREGVRPREARQHAAAVFMTLREAISEKEFADMAAELPNSYATLLPAIAAPRRR
jgi:uncharacterized protein (DUF2267 family)